VNEAMCEEGCAPITCVNTCTLSEENTISSFVLHKEEEPTPTVKYIDQNGRPSSISTETWTATVRAGLTDLNTGFDPRRSVQWHLIFVVLGDADKDRAERRDEASRLGSPSGSGLPGASTPRPVS
jgi:hypothetical protein